MRRIRKKAIMEPIVAAITVVFEGPEEEDPEGGGEGLELGLPELGEELGFEVPSGTGGC